MKTLFLFLSLLFLQPCMGKEWTKTQFLRSILRGETEQVLSMSPEELSLFANIRDKDGHTPLHLACIYQKGKDKTSIIRFLAQHGADLNATRHDLLTPLHMAVLTNHVAAVKTLGKLKGVDPDRIDQNTYTPLLYAVCKKSETLVSSLLSIKSVNPNFGTCDGATPLHFAAMEGSTAIVKLLLAHPMIDINARQDFSQYAGAAPLHFAALQAYPEIVDLLLAREEIDIHLEVTSGLFKGFTPLHFAVMNPNISQTHRVVESLLKQGANPKKGATCSLKSPSELTEISLIKKLLKKKW